jgi:hypothetical protein
VLPTANEAYDTAQSMAFDLAVKQGDEMVRCKVAVSNSDGHSFCQYQSKLRILAAMPMAV